MFNIFKKKENKSCNYAIGNGFDNTYNFTSNYNEAVRVFTDAYYHCNPVAVAVNIIADNIANLPITTIDKKNQFNHDADIITKLASPNDDQTFSRFIKELILYYVVTGNAFIDVNKMSSSYELILLKPQNITLSDVNIDGKANTISYTPNGSSSQVYQEFIYNAKSKNYQSRDGHILLHFKNNNLTTIDTQLGISLLMSAQLEISQYITASVHNNATIKNGCRPSLLFLIKNALTGDQIQGVQDTMRRIAGAKNAGEPFAVTGDVTVEKMSENIKDMDFGMLKKSTENQISKCLKIPLPLINEDNMTYSNYSSAQVALYDNCILPIAKDLFDFLNLKLLPILGETNYKLTVNTAKIKAIESRNIQTALTYQQLNSLSLNELRALIGYETADNGDLIYRANNLVPIATDNYTGDNIRNEKAFFINLLLQQKEYSEDKIKQLANTYFDESKRD
jgi:HK97 family phage portal protein